MTDYFGKTASQEIYKNLAKINKKISKLTIKDLTNAQTGISVKKARKFIQAYKTKVPEKERRELDFDYENLEAKLKIVEKSIEILQK